jgi:hypothetical protein
MPCVSEYVHEEVNMRQNVCRSLVGALLLAFLAGCGGSTDMPSSPQPLSPELQDMKAQILKKHQDRLAHGGRPTKTRPIRNPMQR